MTGRSCHVRVIIVGGVGRLACLRGGGVSLVVVTYPCLELNAWCGGGGGAVGGRSGGDDNESGRIVKGVALHHLVL